MRSFSIRIGAALALATVGLVAPAAAQEYGVAYESSAKSVNDSLRRENAELRARLDSALAGGYEGCDGGCGACCQCADWYDPCCYGPTMVFYLAGDGWKNKADDEDNNNFGNRFGINSSWDLGGSGVRGQLGGSYGIYDYHGREDDNTRDNEEQIFLTAGVYKRASDPCCDYWTWGVVYDYMHDTAYGESGLSSADLHQVRFIVGRLMDSCNEIGVWGAFGIEDDEVFLDDPQFSDPADPVRAQQVRPMDQVNLYWRRYWDCGGETMLYVGLGEEQPANTDSLDPVPGGDDLSEIVVGLRGVAPLSCNVGLFGGFHYVIPSTTAGDIDPNGINNSYAEEIWNVTFGVMFVRGCNLPLLPVADNGLFSVQAPAGAL